MRELGIKADSQTTGLKTNSHQTGAGDRISAFGSGSIEPGSSGEALRQRGRRTALISIGVRLGRSGRSAVASPSAPRRATHPSPSPPAEPGGQTLTDLLAAISIFLTRGRTSCLSLLLSRLHADRSATPEPTPVRAFLRITQLLGARCRQAPARHAWRRSCSGRPAQLLRPTAHCVYVSATTSFQVSRRLSNKASD